MIYISKMSYVSPTLNTTQQQDISAVLVDFLTIHEGSTDAEKTINLPRLNKLIHPAVDYVTSNLPNGVERVDGNVIKPLLNIAVNYKLSLLPPLSSE